jgi:hypothetical protein
MLTFLTSWLHLKHYGKVDRLQTLEMDEEQITSNSKNKSQAQETQRFIPWFSSPPRLA